jgi:hypothetical protein
MPSVPPPNGPHIVLPIGCDVAGAGVRGREPILQPVQHLTIPTRHPGSAGVTLFQMFKHAGPTASLVMSVSRAVLGGTGLRGGEPILQPVQHLQSHNPTGPFQSRHGACEGRTYALRKVNLYRPYHERTRGDGVSPGSAHGRKRVKFTPRMAWCGTQMSASRGADESSPCSRVFSGLGTWGCASRRPRRSAASPPGLGNRSHVRRSLVGYRLSAIGYRLSMLAWGCASRRPRRSAASPPGLGDKRDRIRPSGSDRFDRSSIGVDGHGRRWPIGRASHAIIPTG